MLKEDIIIGNVNKKQANGWNYLYDKFYSTLCRFSFKIVKCSNTAEDIVQDCYITLWNSPLTFPSVESLGGYLYRSVYSRSLNHLRGQLNAIKIENKWQEQLLQWENEDYALEMAIREELITKLHNVLRQLPDQQKEVILFTIHGFKVKEIASKMSISENSVKTHKKRAYNYIKSHLLIDDYILLSILYN